MTKQILLLTSVLLLWACGDTPLDYVDLSEYQAVENAAEDAWQDSIEKFQEKSRKALLSQTSFTDSRDGQVYKQVTIGKQTWMAENLNYKTENSRCGGENRKTEGDCGKYGQIYTWEEAKFACPTGWHIPNFEEWTILLDATGGVWRASGSLGWDYNGDGINAFGFSVDYGGYDSYWTMFWYSAVTYYECSDYERSGCILESPGCIYFLDEDVFEGRSYQYEFFSVRCLKDDASGVSAKSSSSMKKYSSSSVVKMSSSVAKSSSSFIVKSSSSVKITSSSSAKIMSLSSSREQPKSSSSKVTPSSSSKKVVLSSSSTKQSSSSIDLDYYNKQMQGQKGSGLSWKASDGPFVQINENGVKTDWYYWTDSENGGSSGFNRGSVPNIADEKGSGKYTLKEVESIGGVGGKAVLGPSFMMKDSVFHVGSVESGFSGGSIKLPADKMLGLCLEYTNTFDYFVIQIIYDNDEANNWGRPEFHLPIATEKKIINLPWAVFQKISDWAFADVSVYDAIKVMKGVNFQAINNSSKEVFGEFVISKIGAYGTCDDQESGENTVGFMTDSRDGQTYKTVKIGSQTWMAENLNYKSANSYCYNDTVSYCAKYGRLYTWAAAMDSVGAWNSNGKGCGYDNVCSPQYPVQGVCPKGWHLPSRAEWRSLLSAVGGQSVAGTVLKTTSGWNSSGNGTDVFSFSMLPAGLKDDTGVYYDVGDDATFWSSTEGNRYLADYMNFLDRNNEDADFYYYCMRKGFAYSVRCVKD